MPKKTYYKPEYAPLAQRIISNYGYDVDRLGAVFGVAGTTFEAWEKNYHALREAVRDGKNAYEKVRPDAERIRRAEEMLFLRAMGQAWKEVKTVKGADGNVREQTVTEGETAPDVGALMHYLRNRCPERWNEKQTVKLEGENAPPLVVIVKNQE